MKIVEKNMELHLDSLGRVHLKSLSRDSIEHIKVLVRLPTNPETNLGCGFGCT